MQQRESSVLVFYSPLLFGIDKSLVLLLKKKKSLGFSSSFAFWREEEEEKRKPIIGTSLYRTTKKKGGLYRRRTFVCFASSSSPPMMVVVVVFRLGRRSRDTTERERESRRELSFVVSFVQNWKRFVCWSSSNVVSSSVHTHTNARASVR